MKKNFLFLILSLLFIKTSGQINIYPEGFLNAKSFTKVLVKTRDFCTKGFEKEIIKDKFTIDTLGQITEVEKKAEIDKNLTETTIIHTDSRKAIKKDYYTNGKLKIEYFEQVYEYVKDNITTLGFSKNDKKTYEYLDTLIIAKYYRENLLLSVEKFTLNKDGKVLQRELKSLQGKIIKKVNYQYDNKSRLIAVIGNETGKDGFGNSTDGLPFDKTIWKYDKVGKLISKENVYQGRVCNIEKYEYLK
jgi:hypothetical protein